MKIINNSKLNSNNKYYKRSNIYYNSHLILDYFNNHDESVFIVLSNLYEAQKYYDYLNQITNSDNILFYPADQALTTIMALGSFEFQSERLYTLTKLLEGSKQIVVATSDSLLTRQLSPLDYQNSTLKLTKAKTYDFNKIINYLVTNGYKNDYIVSSPGSFAVRGGIIDIYPRNTNNGYRLDFFDDYLESIKNFDIETQRSFNQVEEIILRPLTEIFYTNKMQEKALNTFDKYLLNTNLSGEIIKRIKEDRAKVLERRNLQSLNIYVSLFTLDIYTVLDFSKNKKVFLIDKEKHEKNGESIALDLKVFNSTVGGDFFTKLNFQLGLDYLYNNTDYYINNEASIDNYVDLMVEDLVPYNANTTLLLYDLANRFKDFKVIFNILNDTNKEIIKKMVQRDYILFSDYYLGSFIVLDEKLVVICEEVLFGKKNFYKANYRSVINQASKIGSASELEIGDFVVHYDFGIGKYMGLKTIDSSGFKKDYLHIVYKDDESLYVPMDQIYMILRYSVNEGFTPKLSKMGGKEWNLTKSSVKKKIKDLSDRLIKIYASREEAIGYSFLKDDKMQEAFENDFKYDLTIDQKESIIKVKELMEKPKPMDMLLVGDVGFGKTEVALRAAFKAVLSGKQVMYLVPTTILARQHFLTFKNRMEKYGANVKLMNRFVSKKEQDQTIKDLSKGLVDVVIGTHRLLSKDITFSNLGLLIVDEEQRFGVLHKETIKEIKANVDTLTLSATPIPRTLQMSLMGIKELATIETPPPNRYPVQTYIVRRDLVLVKEAIRRELARGGQVFYLYNRVSDIEKIVFNIEQLVPEAKIGYAHGQMTKVQLENTIRDFIDHKFDILIATTIIETGIDIPNTNTLIIHDADKLGLSQLYQIRGRVGRSDKIAYAYLMYEKNKDVSDIAYKRLKVLEEFTELGSGYKIALRDLAIRGAGDILGSEQSGFIDSVGFEMYMQLLDEVMNKKESLKVKENSLGEFSKRTVRSEYINKDNVRISIHKKITELKSLEQLDDLTNELEDRFGKFDFELLIYMHEQLFNQMMDKIGAYKVENGKNFTKIYLNEQASKKIDGKKLFMLVNTWEEQIKLGFINGEVTIEFIYLESNKFWMLNAAKFISSYLEK